MRARVLGLLLGAGLVTGVALPARPALAVPPHQGIAIVDVQRCIMDTKDGRRAKQALEDLFAKGQGRIDRKAKDLQKELADLQSKAPMLSEAELERRQTKLMQGQAELDQLGMELQQEVAELEAKLTEQIYTKVAAIVEDIAAEDDLDIVLVRSEMTVLWARPEFDLTSRVMARYDAKHQ